MSAVPGDKTALCPPPALEKVSARQYRGFLNKNKVLIWSVEDVSALREEWQLIASPIGSLVNHSSQNMFLGLPYQLEDEAVRLLLDHDAIDLYDGHHYSRPPQEEVRMLQRERTDSIMTQMSHLLYGKELDDVAAQEQSKGNTEPSSKRAKRETGHEDEQEIGQEKQKKTEKEHKAQEDEDDDLPAVEPVCVVDWEHDHPQAPENAKETVAQQDVEQEGEGEGEGEEAAPRIVLPWTLNRRDVERWLKFPWSPRGQQLMEAQRDRTQPSNLLEDELHVEATNTVWCSVKRLALKAIDVVKFMVPTRPASSHFENSLVKLPPNAFAFPATEEERRRALVYKDLHRRGYFLTSGIKFGGDYLVYPGDPYRHHSHFVAIVLSMEAMLSPLELVAAGRLGTVVKKAPLLCGVDKQGGVHYLSIAWTGAN